MLDKINNIMVLNKVIVLIITLVSLYIFSLWDFFIFNDLNGKFIGLVNPDNMQISNFSTWLQLNYKIINGDFFLIKEGFLSFNSGTVSLPFLSLWINSILLKLFGLSYTVLIFSILIPSLCFSFILLIYLRYLPLLWSIFLSFLGLFSISEGPFRNFIFSIFKNFPNTFDIDVNKPDIMGMPFPSLSLLAFVITLFYTIQRTYLSKNRTLVLSFLWGLQIHFHIINAIIGIPFWIITLIIISNKQFRGIWSYDFYKYIFIRILLLTIVCLPSLIMLFLANPGLHYFINNETNFNFFTIIMYFLIPLSMLYISYLVFRVDPYEIFIKFIPIWSMMIVELIILLLWIFFRLGIPDELIIGRLGLFFLHLF